jgi:hypothetical protein
VGKGFLTFIRPDGSPRQYSNLFMENSAYIDAMVASRSVLLSDEEALAGGTTISCETTDEWTTSMSTARTTLPNWLRVIRVLNQELLLSYDYQPKTVFTNRLPTSGLTARSQNIFPAVHGERSPPRPCAVLTSFLIAARFSLVRLTFVFTTKFVTVCRWCANSVLVFSGFN